MRGQWRDQFERAARPVSEGLCPEHGVGLQLVLGYGYCPECDIGYQLREPWDEREQTLGPLILHQRYRFAEAVGNAAATLTRGVVR